jgi:hypothetical protein
MTVEHFTPDDLRAFSAAVFASAGLPQDHADIIARDLIKANLRGLDSHGPILFAFPVLLQCLCCSVAIGGEFWHLGVHALIVTPSLGSFKSPGSLFVTLSRKN